MNSLYFKNIRINILFMGLVALFPLYKINYNSYSILLLVVYGLITSLKTRVSREKLVIRIKEKKNIFFLTSLIFFVFIFSLLFSENLSYGIRSVQHLIPLLLFPISFFFLSEKISKKEITIIFKIYLVGCFLHIIYIHYNFYDLGLYNNIQEAKFYKLPFRDAVLNFEYESLHPTYLSLWYCFAIVLILKDFERLKLGKNTLILFIKITFILVLVGTIILLSSRIGILALIIVLFCFFLRLRNKKTKWTLSFLFIIAIAFSFKNVSYISSRFINEFKQTKMSPPVGKEHNSVNIRIGIYECSLKVIKNNLFFGVGIGDVQDRLNDCFSNFNTDVYQQKNYNSHNYFLHSLLVAGIIGLFAVLIMFYVLFKLALQFNSYAYICFLLIVIIALLFENILSRNNGVMFFAFFNTLFVQYFDSKKYVNSFNSSI
ncbi:O-antigen ligase family protein [Aquimarina sp. 2201CG14-23]|uniref:O-antigen ligase family protein n=1 Tax=Aquimarina mycalae TaxID=3040073 RepID=UPI0024781B65|nr:O-antigen ligase family protein [Aquimarina sp. 2201CG14-23]MDH7446370.1 O-antigen ligase family protein [Aquimarina sp. 2201CG14-23]